MSNFEDIEVCHRFMSATVPLVAPISQRRFVIVEHSVCDEEFVIWVDYDKDQFGHLTNEYVYKILEERKNSKLHKYCWAVHRPLCDDIEVPDGYCLHSVIILKTR